MRLQNDDLRYFSSDLERVFAAIAVPPSATVLQTYCRNQLAGTRPSQMWYYERLDVGRPDKSGEVGLA